MRKNSDIPPGRKYDLFREMLKRTEETREEGFTAYQLRQTPGDFQRNPKTLRRDLDELSEEGLVVKEEKLLPIKTYKPDDPSSFDLKRRILDNSKARLNNLIRFRLLTRSNIHFECLECGRFFRVTRLALFPPFRLCPYCFGNSKFRLGIKTRSNLFL
ncbi:MAG: hypothetical protein JSV51_04865 [Candidatus Bathyarchaeota archaeon]|nr:MAG: hypothetical protein JSV51_04865 [Candidatus Bathyarchaeota archaeon]